MHMQTYAVTPLHQLSSFGFIDIYILYTPSWLPVSHILSSSSCPIHLPISSAKIYISISIYTIYYILYTLSHIPPPHHDIPRAEAPIHPRRDTKTLPQQPAVEAGSGYLPPWYFASSVFTVSIGLCVGHSLCWFGTSANTAPLVSLQANVHQSHHDFRILESRLVSERAHTRIFYIKAL